MAKQIPMWKTSDGRVFETQAKADAHEEATTMLRRYQVNGCSLYTQLCAILEDYTLVRRVYTEELKHD